eukprot:9741799-Alexandrium_andersonii.AAC.1
MRGRLRRIGPSSNGTATGGNLPEAPILTPLSLALAQGGPSVEPPKVNEVVSLRSCFINLRWFCAWAAPKAQ